MPETPSQQALARQKASFTNSPCPSCQGRGWVSGGELSDGHHVPAMCRDCLGTGKLLLGLQVEKRPQLPDGNWHPGPAKPERPALKLALWVAFVLAFGVVAAYFCDYGHALPVLP